MPIPQTTGLGQQHRRSSTWEFRTSLRSLFTPLRSPVGINCVCGSTIGHIFNPRCYITRNVDSLEVIGPDIGGGQTDVPLRSVSFEVRGEYKK